MALSHHCSFRIRLCHLPMKPLKLSWEKKKHPHNKLISRGSIEGGGKGEGQKVAVPKDNFPYYISWNRVYSTYNSHVREENCHSKKIAGNFSVIYLIIYDKYTWTLEVLINWHTGQTLINMSQSLHKHKCLQGINNMLTSFDLHALQVTCSIKPWQFLVRGLAFPPGMFR